MNIKIDYIYNKLKKYDYKIDNQINLYNPSFINKMNKIKNILDNKKIFNKLNNKLNNKFDLTQFYKKIYILIGGNDRETLKIINGSICKTKFTTR
jgi:hypothetical protein